MFRRYLFSRSPADDGHLREWILDDPEPYNRLLLLGKVGLSALRKDEIERLGADKSVIVRRRLFYAQLESGITPSKANLISLSLDTNRTLRQLGQFYLKDLYQKDAYSLYQAKNGQEFFYIADYGRKEDAEQFLKGIRSGSRATQLNCLRALVSSAPEHLEDFDLPTLVAQNRKFRTILLPVLPRVLSLDAILLLRPAIEGSSPFGIVSFLRLLEMKSFWTFVDEALDFLLSDPPLALSRTIIRAIQSKGAIYESLSAERRESISGKIASLRVADQERYERLASFLEFILRTS